MIPHPPFNLEQFALCYRTYTAALLDIQYEKGRANQRPPGNETCLTVALRIIEASANGERDASRLKTFALHDLMGHSNRSSGLSDINTCESDLAA